MGNRLQEVGLGMVNEKITQLAGNVLTRAGLKPDLVQQIVNSGAIPQIGVGYTFNDFKGALVGIAKNQVSNLVQRKAGEVLSKLGVSSSFIQRLADEGLIPSISNSLALEAAQKQIPSIGLSTAKGRMNNQLRRAGVKESDRQAIWWSVSHAISGGDRGSDSNNAAAKVAAKQQQALKSAVATATNAIKSSGINPTLVQKLIESGVVEFLATKSGGINALITLLKGATSSSLSQTAVQTLRNAGLPANVVSVFQEIQSKFQQVAKNDAIGLSLVADGIPRAVVAGLAASNLLEKMESPQAKKALTAFVKHVSSSATLQSARVVLSSIGFDTQVLDGLTQLQDQLKRKTNAARLLQAGVAKQVIEGMDELGFLTELTAPSIHAIATLSVGAADPSAVVQAKSVLASINAPKQIREGLATLQSNLQQAAVSKTLLASGVPQEMIAHLKDKNAIGKLSQAGMVAIATLVKGKSSEKSVAQSVAVLTKLGVDADLVSSLQKFNVGLKVQIATNLLVSAGVPEDKVDMLENAALLKFVTEKTIAEAFATMFSATSTDVQVKAATQLLKSTGVKTEIVDQLIALQSGLATQVKTELANKLLVAAGVPKEIISVLEQLEVVKLITEASTAEAIGTLVNKKMDYTSVKAKTVLLQKVGISDEIVDKLVKIQMRLHEKTVDEKKIDDKKTTK
eukprot:TRINITY_DN8304_c0_g1_i1.p1 TRINITY_DN8304_c0_g1~~TRINITY_DN8304_c0_g1_i1.p1  ORF type:complete len:782 (+),score=294.35 TRINITY_DN8304_c0_g1_i1:300-2348(+)